jgi:excisionase family DNA binding protein
MIIRDRTVHDWTRHGAVKMSDGNPKNLAGKQTTKPRIKIVGSKGSLPSKPVKSPDVGAPTAGLAPARHNSRRSTLRPTPLSNQVELLTLRQIADHLQVSTKTVRREIDRRTIPYVWVGNQKRVRTDHLVLFTRKHR